MLINNKGNPVRYETYLFFLLTFVEGLTILSEYSKK